MMYSYGIRPSLKTRTEDFFTKIYEEFGEAISEEDLFLKVECEYVDDVEEGYWSIQELIQTGYITEDSGIFILHPLLCEM